GNELSIFDSRKVDGDTGGKPGEVVDIADDHILVAAPGGAVKVMRLRPHDDKKITAPEYVAKVGLQKGKVLGA
ncbi:MAG TPA: hypothetical protein DEB21_19400, partial [Rhodospirillaceae bacterium]|nr:hypothetical protein [Rhodospirillaceae bacterium]